MTSLQIKTEIGKLLDEIPENSLQDVLDLLKEIQLQPSENIKLTNNIKKILAEDKELLERLAQ